MNILDSIIYDPAVAVTKATTALLAMTAFDTTNIRLTVTVPAHGLVTFKMRCVIHGGNTFPQILLGVMTGSTVRGRMAPRAAIGGTALGTTFLVCEAEFTVSGLTPGSTAFDMAYSVETLVASTGIKYGGPNDTTGNNAFGGILFEAWDPRPNGSVLTSIGDTRIANLDAAVSTRSTYAGADTAGTTTLLTRIPSTLTITAGAVTVGALETDSISAAAVSAAAVTKIQAGLPAAILDLTDGVETGVTPRGALRALLATLAGRATGGDTTTVTFSNPSGGASRVVMTVDENGNRSSVTLSV